MCLTDSHGAGQRPELWSFGDEKRDSETRRLALKHVIESAALGRVLY